MKLRILATIGALMLLAASAHAQGIGYYHTGNKDANGANASTTGMENSAIIISAANLGAAGSRHFLMLSALGYGAAAEVAMCFDSATLPATGAIPIAACPLAPAASTPAPSSCSFALPFDGLPLSKGLTCACSTTGQTLTTDTTSGGNCFFGIGWK
jgi:hypothetical protein